jgi:hypothetical protein
LKNLNISRTKQDKFVKQKHFVGKETDMAHYALKMLLPNREDKFLKRLVTYIVVKASTVCMEHG